MRREVIRLECPYCGKEHSYEIYIPESSDDEKTLPHDEDTDDLENFREEIQ